MIPSGKLYGALPDQIFIKGVQWICIETRTEEDGTIIDSLKSTATKEIREVERYKLLNYLEKNYKKDLDTNKKNVPLTNSNQLNLLK